MNFQDPAIFSTSEYEGRLSKLRSYMADQELDACVFTSYHNINYYSGFLFCHFGRFYGLVVTQDDEVTLSAGEELYQFCINAIKSP